MFRRGFLKAVVASTGAALLWPFKVTDAMRTPIVVPFLPTLEWLREHNPDITAVCLSLNETGISTGPRYMRGVGPSSGQTWTGYVYRTIYQPSTFGTFKDTMAQVFWNGGRWVAVEQLRLAENGSKCFTDQVEWPDWLRRF